MDSPAYESDLVIKIKHGGTLKRLNAHVIGHLADIDITGIRSKIISAFKLGADADFTLTYTDEDGDAVLLDDYDDLLDAAVRQKLNPLRINVQLRHNDVGVSEPKLQTSNSTSSTPPMFDNPLTKVISLLDEALKSRLQSVHTSLSTTSRELLVKAASDAPNSQSSSVPVADSRGSSSSSSGATNKPVTANGDDEPNLLRSSATSSFAIGCDTENPQKKHKTKNVPKCKSGMVDASADLKNAEKQCETKNVPKSGEASQNPQASAYPSVDDLLFSGWTNFKYAESNEIGNPRDKRESAMFTDLPPLPHAAPLMSNFSRSIVPPRPPFLPYASEIYTRKPMEPPKSLSSFARTFFGSDDCKQLPIGANSSSPTPSLDGTVKLPLPNIPPPARLFPIGHPYMTPEGNHANRLPGFHRWTKCGGCGIQPITGTRYQSIGNPNYELCSDCFSRMGCKEDDYVIIDYVNRKGLKDFSTHPTTLLRFPRRVKCNGCGIPIMGMRYQSIVNEGYELCSLCFLRMGCKEADYAVIDHFNRKDHKGFTTNRRYNYLPSHGPWIRQKKPKLESRFIQDVTISDGTTMMPSTPFTKIWRMRNNGITFWPFGTRLVCIGGDQFASQTSIQLEIPSIGFPIDGEIDIAVRFTAPSRRGRYISYWRLASPTGQKFGQRVWVLIQVDQSADTAGTETKSRINLNLPPEGSTQITAHIIDVNSKPINDISEPEAEKSREEMHGPATQIIKPVAAVVIPASDPAAPPAVVSSPAKPKTALDGNNLDEALLKELEEMGFKQVDLNKEVLRVNKYDLEESVDDLCGLADWDSLVGEMQELGFSEKEVNKELLGKKDEGSINGALLGLISVEKAREKMD